MDNYKAGGPRNNTCKNLSLKGTNVSEGSLLSFSATMGGSEKCHSFPKHISAEMLVVMVFFELMKD